MDQPLVSICIPTFNGESYLQETFDSISDQTYSNIEVIISDDNSRDGTLDIIEAFNRTADFPVSVLRHTPSGIGANWNNCARNAKGKYIKYVFQDDLIMPSCIDEMVRILELNKDFGLVASKRDFIVSEEAGDSMNEWIRKYSNLQVGIESQGEVTILDKGLFSRLDFTKTPLNKIGEPSAILFRRSVLEEIGYFSESLEQILDFVAYYQILKHHKIVIINKTLVKFRLHGNQATQKNEQRSINDYDKYSWILFDEFLPYLHLDTQVKLKNRFKENKGGIKFLKRIKSKISTLFK